MGKGLFPIRVFAIFRADIETFLHPHAFPINSVKLHTVTKLRGLHVETLVEVRSSQKVQPYF